MQEWRRMSHMESSTQNAVLQKLIHAYGNPSPLSGAFLATSLDISRVAVWKAIEGLRAQGYAIDSTKGGGYRLNPRPQGLLPGEVAAGLNTRRVGRRIEFTPEVTSTNTWAMELARTGAPSGTVVIAGRQTSGRGRLHRQWDSPAGGLYLSVVFRPRLPLASLGIWSLLASLAVADAVNDILNDARIRLKWPNDIFLDNKKLGGILCEATGHPDSVDWVVTGIGLNVNAPPLADLSDQAIHLAGVTGSEISLRRLCQNVIEALDRKVVDELSPPQIQKLTDEWMQKAYGLGQPARILGWHKDRPAELGRGLYLGIDETGQALLQEADGPIRAFPAGDLSLKVPLHT